jgi:hypothetical protein
MERVMKPGGGRAAIRSGDVLCATLPGAGVVTCPDLGRVVIGIGWAAGPLSGCRDSRRSSCGSAWACAAHKRNLASTFPPVGAPGTRSVHSHRSLVRIRPNHAGRLREWFDMRCDERLRRA